MKISGENNYNSTLENLISTQITMYIDQMINFLN